ncbi:MAG: hypothetical protein ABIG71_00740 [Candidatus Uhrbacteria bacterium]
MKGDRTRIIIAALFFIALITLQYLVKPTSFHGLTQIFDVPLHVFLNSNGM